MLCVFMGFGLEVPFFNTSLQTKAVLLLVREYHVIKARTHDAGGHLMSYVTDVLRSRVFPLKDHTGSAFKAGSKESLEGWKSFLRWLSGVLRWV